MKKNIAIRVDANKQIGLGHLLRVKGFIYRNFNSYKKFILITKGDKSITKQILNNKKIEFFFIKNSKLTEIEDIYQILEKTNSNILLSDISYNYYLNLKNFFKNYHLYFKKKKILTVSIDDPRQFLSSDLSVVPYPTNKNFLNLDKQTKLIQGVKFISFNSDIFKKKKIIKKKVKNILIALGGFDFKNQSYNLLKMLLKQDYDFHIKVLSNKNYLKKILNLPINKKKIKVITNIQNINKLLDWSDLVFTGEGNLRFEAAVKGVPLIFFNNIDNSKKNIKLIKIFLKMKTASFLNYKTLNEKKLSILLKNYLNNNKLRVIQSMNGLKHFDLDGAKRLNNEILKLYYKKNIIK